MGSGVFSLGHGGRGGGGARVFGFRLGGDGHIPLLAGYGFRGGARLGFDDVQTEELSALHTRNFM